ncbi:MAG: beta-galactosidase domain 4-containing protein, partial [bacterium]
GRPILAYGGGFGEEPNDAYFIHKGVVWHDRTPKPHYPEMKRAYQWIGIEAVGPGVGSLRIRNRYAFTSLAPGAFAAGWEVAEDGRVVARGALPVPVIAPGGEVVVRVPPARVKPKPGREYHLRVAFRLARKAAWAPVGHEVAAAQFLLPLRAPAVPLRATGLPPVKLAETGDEIAVTGPGFAVRFSRAAGTLTALETGGRNLLLPGGGPRPHLWRAPHRNDDDWADAGWRRHGLRTLAWRTLSVAVERLSAGAVRVTISSFGEGRKGFGLNHGAVWTVRGDGVVLCDHALNPRGRRIALARLGVRMFLEPRLSRVEYFGRGPHENYADRKRGSDLGRYASTVAAQLTPYAKPMECGNHEDVRWLAVGDPRGASLILSAPGTPVQASVLPYADEELEGPAYDRDLPPSRATVL